ATRQSIVRPLSAAHHDDASSATRLVIETAALAGLLFAGPPRVRRTLAASPPRR
ncbi:MAG: hypothetical protein V7636_56, partial [Actinomycetota bacterium]